MSLSLPASRPQRNSPAAPALAARVLAATPALSQDGGRVLESPRLRALAGKIRAGTSRALAEFWDAVQREGAPLVEPVAGDSTRLLVTFVYHGDSATRNVVLFRGPRVSLNLADNPFVRLAGTDLWYRSYRVRRDARFTYLLGANVDLSPQDPNDARDLFRRLAAFRLDPLNPLQSPRPGDPPPRHPPPFYRHSAVEPPGAPPQPWVAQRAGVAAGWTR